MRDDGFLMKPRFSLLHLLGLLIVWHFLTSLQQSFEVSIRTHLELAAFVPDTSDYGSATPMKQQTSNVTAFASSTIRKGTPRPKPQQFRLFTCGYESGGAKYFPDYKFMGEWSPEDIPVTSTVNDLLVIGAFGPCDETKIKYILSESFAGKVLYVMGEPYGNVFWRDTLTPEFKAKHISLPSEWWEELLEHVQNGGDPYHPHISRVFQIGPFLSKDERVVPNKSNITLDDVKVQVYNRQSFPVIYGSVIVAAEVPDLWPLLSDHSKKPQNTGNFSAIAWIQRNCAKHRIETAQMISKTIPIPVYSGGKCEISKEFNPENQRMPAHFIQDRKQRKGNHLIFSNFKYCLVMENNNVQGYLSEKIIYAYLGGCLPIYWGNHQKNRTGLDYDVFDVFHPESLIYFDPEDPQPAMDLLQMLEANDTEYKRRLKDVPILRNGMETADKYFSLLPGVGRGSVNNGIRSMMGLAHISGL